MKKEFKLRKGKIVLSLDFLFDTDEELLFKIFSEFLPIKLQIHHGDPIIDRVDYYGFCNKFRELSEGEVIPEYKVEVIETNIDGKTEYEINFNEIK